VDGSDFYQPSATDERANQGDVFQSVDFGNGGRLNALIVAHDCVLDKYLRPRTPLPPGAAQKWAITVAPVIRIQDIDENHQPEARKGNMARYFYLPAGTRLTNGEPFGEMVADLWMEQPVLFGGLLECDRIACLTDMARGRLWQQFLRLRIGKDWRESLKGLIADAP
jgi:hypothetical protein